MIEKTMSDNAHGHRTCDLPNAEGEFLQVPSSLKDYSRRNQGNIDAQDVSNLDRRDQGIIDAQDVLDLDNNEGAKSRQTQLT